MKISWNLTSNGYAYHIKRKFSECFFTKTAYKILKLQKKGRNFFFVLLMSILTTSVIKLI
jgi:hypothetical protein